LKIILSIISILPINLNLFVYKDGDTALHKAASNDKLEIVELLLQKGADIEAKDKYGYTVLHKAARYSKLEIVNLLLEKGANIEAKDKYGETALHKAASNNKLEMVELLLQKSADIEAKDKYGYTVLHKAARYSKLETVNLLLEKGANIEAKDEDGDTALHKAAHYSKLEIVDLLLQKGADIKAIGRYGTASDNALSSLDDLLPKNIDSIHFFFDIVKINRKLEILELLLQKGDDITLTHNYFFNYYEDSLPYNLLKKGSIPDIKHSYKYDHNCILFKLRIVEYLLKEDAVSEFKIAKNNDLNEINKFSDAFRAFFFKIKIRELHSFSFQSNENKEEIFLQVFAAKGGNIFILSSTIDNNNSEIEDILTKFKTINQVILSHNHIKKLNKLLFKQFNQATKIDYPIIKLKT
jgi:ankyrin repeat protein